MQAKKRTFPGFWEEVFLLLKELQRKPPSKKKEEKGGGNQKQEEKEKRGNKLKKERLELIKKIGEIRKKALRIDNDKIAQALDPTYNKKVREITERLKQRDIRNGEGEIQEIKDRQRRCTNIEIQQRKREIWKKK